MSKIDETKSTSDVGSVASVPLMENKSADLSKVGVKNFVGVSCTEGHVYALAVDGHLYVYDQHRKVEKWMNIRVDRAFACTAAATHLLCGCSDGTIRVFSTSTLEHIVTLPKPPPLGSANVEAGVKKIRIPASKESKFADAVAVQMDVERQKIVVLYSDRMMFMWDIKKLEKIGVFRTFLHHCGPIYDLEALPSTSESVTRFATCSTDKTIRFWNYYDYANQELHR